MNQEPNTWIKLIVAFYLFIYFYQKQCLVCLYGGVGCKTCTILLCIRLLIFIKSYQHLNLSNCSNVEHFLTTIRLQLAQSRWYIKRVINVLTLNTGITVRVVTHIFLADLLFGHDIPVLTFCVLASLPLSSKAGVAGLGIEAPGVHQLGLIFYWRTEHEWNSLQFTTVQAF